MTPSKNPTRSFLVTHPRPAKVRLVLANGEVRTLEPGASPNWKRLAETVDALAPTTIEALDASDKLLRARNPEQAAEREELEPEDEPEDPTTPMMGDGQLETFARLIADAHRSTGERAFQFVECAFSRMVEIVNAQTKRMDGMERVVEGIHKSWRRAYEASLDGAAEEPEPNNIQQLLAAFLQGQAQAAVRGAVAPPTPATSTNGVHPKQGG